MVLVHGDSSDCCVVLATCLFAFMLILLLYFGICFTIGLPFTAFPIVKRVMLCPALQKGCYAAKL